MEGRRSVITGAGGAIGRASAVAFAREGASVAIVDISIDAAQACVEEIAASGGSAFAIHADVADTEQAREAADEAAARMGGIDSLFNNAGIMPHQDHSLLDADPELWSTILDINLRGTVHMTKYCAPYIVRHGWGSIVNMSSFLAVLGCSNPQDAYAASKGAITSITRSLAVQLGRSNVSVNAIAPGPILTAHVAAFFPDDDARRIRLERFPLGRFGTVEDVAETACFLASTRASWITGQVIVIDGGASINYV